MDELQSLRIQIAAAESQIIMALRANRELHVENSRLNAENEQLRQEAAKSKQRKTVKK